MRRFLQRSQERELMDMEGVAFDEFHECLRHLEVINHLTLAYRPVLTWLNNIIERESSLVVLDAGCGGGDTLRQIEKKLAHRAKLKLIGVDLNPWAKQSAEARSQSMEIHYETSDIFAFEPKQHVDVVIASLFTHHLTEPQIIEFLRWIDQRAQVGWFINDLHRHAVPYYFIKAATRIFSGNRLIRNDAAVSVARSFTRAEWHRLLAAAGIYRAEVRWYFPFRFCVACRKG